MVKNDEFESLFSTVYSSDEWRNVRGDYYKNIRWLQPGFFWTVVWNNDNIDRGGHYYITHFWENKSIRSFSSVTGTTAKLDQLQKSACGNPNILHGVSKQYIDNTEKKTKLLREIVDERMDCSMWPLHCKWLELHMPLPKRTYYFLLLWPGILKIKNKLNHTHKRSQSLDHFLCLWWCWKIYKYNQAIEKV